MSDGNKDEAQKSAPAENPVQEGNEVQAATAPEGGAQQPETTSPKADEGNQEAAENAPKDEKNTQEEQQPAKQEESKADEPKAADEQPKAEGAPAVNLEGVVDQEAAADELN